MSHVLAQKLPSIKARFNPPKGSGNYMCGKEFSRGVGKGGGRSSLDASKDDCVRNHERTLRNKKDTKVFSVNTKLPELRQSGTFRLRTMNREKPKRKVENQLTLPRLQESKTTKRRKKDIRSAPSKGVPGVGNCANMETSSSSPSSSSSTSSSMSGLSPSRMESIASNRKLSTGTLSPRSNTPLSDTKSDVVTRQSNMPNNIPKVTLEPVWGHRVWVPSNMKPSRDSNFHWRDERRNSKNGHKGSYKLRSDLNDNEVTKSCILPAINRKGSLGAPQKKARNYGYSTASPRRSIDDTGLINIRTKLAQMSKQMAWQSKHQQAPDLVTSCIQTPRSVTDGRSPNQSQAYDLSDIRDQLGSDTFMTQKHQRNNDGDDDDGERLWYNEVLNNVDVIDESLYENFARSSIKGKYNKPKKSNSKKKEDEELVNDESVINMTNLPKRLLEKSQHFPIFQPPDILGKPVKKTARLRRNRSNSCI